MEIEIRDVSFAGHFCQTRIPFRFGEVTLSGAPLLTARVVIESEGEQRVGFSADLTVPKWFEKNPAASSAQDMRSLIASARRAGAAFEGLRGGVFDLWWRAYQVCVRGGAASGVPLADGFGVALIERAVIDASCRAANLSFRDALEQDLFGFRPERLLPETAGLDSKDLLAPASETEVTLRHTVGGLDPLRPDDVPPELRGDDGHPVSLEEDIERYALTAFKLKAGAGLESDLARLTEISRVVQESGVEDPLYTLDANEQYPDLDQLGRLLTGLESDPDGREILAGLAYVEQPLPRAATLDPGTRPDVAALSKTVPLLIDEADHDIDAFPRALEIGYAGVSVKNCKGVFRAFANRALCRVRGQGIFQTSEDLTNLPVLSLQQDLSTLAALGLTHTERNGHHFFAGLDALSTEEAESALAAHPDLYTRQGNRIGLRIRSGKISLGCQHSIGYGYASEIDWSSRQSDTELEESLPR